MSLIKGSVTLTRYKVLDDPPELTEEFVAERLQQNAFIDIEATTAEDSLGWVEALDPFAVDFDSINFKFNDILAMQMRVDTRKVPAKMVNRYLALALSEAEKQTDRPLNTEQRRELKARVRLDLLARTPVSTDVYEVCWLTAKDEVWLAAAGSKVRERFEELWRRTFALGLLLKIPYVLARDHLPEGVTSEKLDQIRASALFGRGGY